MSLIQAALEKAGKSSSIQEFRKMPKGKVSLQSPKPTLLGEENERVERDIQNIRKLRTMKSVAAPKKNNAANIVVFLFGLSIVMIAAAAFFILGSEISTNWQGRSVNKPVTGKSIRTVFQAPATIESASIEKVKIAGQPEHLPIFELSGITTLGAERFALIDNQIRGVGDRLRTGFVVSEIQAKKVILARGDLEIALNL